MKFVAHKDTVTACGTDVCRQQTAPHVSPFLLWGGVRERSLGHPRKGTWMTALFSDLKLSIRAGGGALIGVLFFLTVVAVIPFGVGPDLKLLSRIGPAIVVDRRAACDLAWPRPLVPGRTRRRFAGPLMHGAGNGTCSHSRCWSNAWRIGRRACLPLVIASPLLGLFMNMDAVGDRCDDADAAWSATPAITLHRRRGRGGRRCAAARRPAGLDPRPAADHTGADLRRQLRTYARS